MTKVDDALGQTITQSFDFYRENPVNNTALEFQYDPSGNLTEDINRFWSIDYNHLNKPTKVEQTANGDSFIEGTCPELAEGSIQQMGPSLGKRSMSKIPYENKGTAGNNPESGQPIGGGEPVPDKVIKITDYVNAWEYVDPDGQDLSPKALTHILHSKGRTVPVGSNWIQEFFLKDHLGNTRVVFGDYDGDQRINPDPSAQHVPGVVSGDLRQVVEGYYPFGLAFNDFQNTAFHPENQYLYNGKEKQDELDLGWYDYGARMYDASLIRWNGVDALAEHPNQIDKSTYAYAWNNPTNLTDPDGNCPTCVAGAVIGGAVGFIYGAAKNGFRKGGWKKVISSTVAGAVTGGIAGTGVGAVGLLGLSGSAGATASFTIISGTVGAVAGHGAEQGVNMLLGESFDQQDFKVSMQLALPSGILEAVVGPTSDAIKGGVTTRITSTIGQELTVRQKNQMAKQYAKQIRGALKDQGLRGNKRKIRRAADQMVREAVENQGAYVEGVIQTSERGVDVSIGVVTSKVTDVAKDEIKKQDGN